MTTVLPEPVAILSATRGRPGLCVVVRRRAGRSRSRRRRSFVGDLGEVDRRLERLDLAEEQRLLALRVGPVLEQARRRCRHADVAAGAPQGDPLADAVDAFVLFDAVLRPLRLERSCCPFFWAARSA